MVDGWKTLRCAIPERATGAVAARLGLSANYLRRWRREPLSDEAPLATGLRSPLDRIVDLIDAVYLVSPKGVAHIIDHINGHYHELIQASFDPDHWEEREKRTDAADLLREATDAVNALNLDAPHEETIRELVEAKAAIDRATQKMRNAAATKRIDLGGKVDPLGGSR